MPQETYYRKPDYRPGTHDWLARARRWDIEYKAYLSNHLTHNWVVMGGIGVPDDIFQWWEDLYANRLPEKPSREPGDLERPRSDPLTYTVINRLNWRNNIQSTRAAFSAFRDFFDAELADKGMSETIRLYLPALLPGLAGAALHPLIHSGWAADVESLDMLGEGLAYMACSSQPLGIKDPHCPPTPLWSAQGPDPIDAMLAFLTADNADELARIASEASETATYRAVNRGGFQHRIMAFDDPALPLSEVLNAVGPLGLPDIDKPLTDAIERLTAFMAAALLGSDNEFFVLHGLTSLHGLLVLLPHLDPADRRDALVHWWRAAAATMIVQNRPGLARTLEEWERTQEAGGDDVTALDEETDIWWRETIKSVLCSRDEHVPKAAYVLWRWSAWGAFSSSNLRLFRRAARNLVAPNESGEIHENLWFAKSFSEASELKEKEYG